MLTARSPWETAHHASSVPTTPVLAESHAEQPDITTSARSSERSTDVDQSNQDAIESPGDAEPASRRRAIGIMFGIDPKNLYESPSDQQSRDRAVRDMD